jgi:hypothetical protein
MTTRGGRRRPGVMRLLVVVIVATLFPAAAFNMAHVSRQRHVPHEMCRSPRIAMGLRRKQQQSEEQQQGLETDVIFGDFSESALFPESSGPPMPKNLAAYKRKKPASPEAAASEDSEAPATSDKEGQ